MIKKILFLSLFLVGIIVTSNNPCFGITVGNSLDIDLPPQSALLRQQAVNETLDEYEQAIKVKGAFDIELMFEKELNTTSEVTGAEIKGQWYMAKLGIDIFNRVEPYIKIGLSDLEAKWRQNNSDDIKVEADKSFAWGGGLKGIILELENMGLRLTGDVQYRITDPDAGDIMRAGTPISDTGADFRIEEWQAALVLSKKFELPLKRQSIYIVPYTGFTVSDSTADIKFTDPANPAADYTLFKGNNDSLYGFLIGCDIMPKLNSSFIYSIELRLLSETALTLGGAMKF